MWVHYFNGIAWLSAWLCHTSTDIQSKSDMLQCDDVMHGDDIPLCAGGGFASLSQMPSTSLRVH